MKCNGDALLVDDFVLLSTLRQRKASIILWGGSGGRKGRKERQGQRRSKEGGKQGRKEGMEGRKREGGEKGKREGFLHPGIQAILLFFSLTLIEV